MKTAGIASLLVCLAPAALAGEPYAFVEGGVGWSPDKSNSDEVEFGNEPGGSLAGGVGYQLPLADHWRVNVEGQLTGQIIPLHGRNDTGEETADGKYFGLIGMTANAWPEFAFDEHWSLYIGGGVGPAGIRAFGDWSATMLVIAGGGVRYAPNETISLDLGGRYWWTRPVDVDGARSTYDTAGPTFRLIAFFR